MGEKQEKIEKLREIRAYASREAVPILQDESSEFICKFIKEHNVKKVLEIGTAIGYSSIKFASVREDVFVTSIEIDIDRFIRAQQNIKAFNLSDRIHLIHDDALKCNIEDKNFDLIFIDAAKAQYINFFEKYKENLAENGVIISDNLSFHGMVQDITLTHNYSTKKLVKKIQMYVAYLKTNEEFETEFFELGDGISVSRKKKSR